MPNRVYLDHAATSPLLPQAAEAMQRGFSIWANPSSPHAEGRAARAALEEARAAVSAALGLRHALLFTSGASEGIGLVMTRAKAGRRIVGATEHDAVRRAGGGNAIVLPVDGEGRVDPAAAYDAAVAAGPRPLVAVQAVNSETGVIQPLDEIAGRVQAAGGLLLADCAQSAGKLPLPEQADFIIVSGHKLGVPIGIGALLVRDLATLEPSGGQEQGYRSGTENLPGALALAAALDAGGWIERAGELREHVETVIEAEGGIVVAKGAPRLPTIGAYRMPGVSARTQLIRFDLAGIAVSAGSACASGSLKPSHVLAAMGLGEAEAGEVIRVSFGPRTRRADIYRFLEAWRQIAEGARA